MVPSGPAAGRLPAAAQLTLGLTTLLRPDATVRTLTPAGSAVPDRRIVRVLGLRQVVQGAIGLAVPTPDVAAVGAAVDALHALSLVPFLVTRNRWRPAAAASAALAATAAVGGFRASRA